MFEEFRRRKLSRRSRCARLLGIVIWLLVPTAASSDRPMADEPTPPAPTPASPMLRAKPVSGGLRIDGRLDEPEWQSAETIPGLSMIEPVEGAEPTLSTEVRVLAGHTSLRLWDGTAEA